MAVILGLFENVLMDLMKKNLFRTFWLRVY